MKFWKGNSSLVQLVLDCSFFPGKVASEWQLNSKFKQMAILQRATVNSFSDEDKGLLVKEAIELVKNSIYIEEIMDTFNLSEIENEFIEVPGARKLVETVLAMEEQVIKLDLDTPLNKLRCKKLTESGQAVLEIAEIEDEEARRILKSDMIKAETRYSVRADYFNGLYDIDKYISFLLKKGYNDIIDANINMLEKKNEDENNRKSLRLILNGDERPLIRALTSTDRYKDYNIRFSVFVTLMQLHKLNKNNEESFRVNYFSLTESEVKVIFKQLKTYKFVDDSKLSFALELTNDEIKREAVRLKGVYSISVKNGKDVYLKPEEGTSTILSFNHSLNIGTVGSKLSELHQKIKSFLDETMEDFKFSKNVKNPDDIRLHLVSKVIRSREKEFQKYKSEILNTLSNRISTIFQLLDVVGVVDDIIKDEDIQAKDFWQYKLYQALVEDLKKN